MEGFYRPSKETINGFTVGDVYFETTTGEPIKKEYHPNDQEYIYRLWMFNCIKLKNRRRSIDDIFD